MWPRGGSPLCTSTFKRDPTDKFIRAISNGKLDLGLAERPNKILLLTGERAAESASRAKKPDWQLRSCTAPKKGRLVLWNRHILRMSTKAVFDYLRENNIPVPSSYAEGHSRHSCQFCIWKSFAEQCLSAVQQPEALAYRVRVEEQIDHRVNLAYRYIDEAGNEHIGFRAVWEFVYGPWQIVERAITLNRDQKL